MSWGCSQSEKALQGSHILVLDELGNEGPGFPGFPGALRLGLGTGAAVEVARAARQLQHSEQAGTESSKNPSRGQPSESENSSFSLVS